MCAIKHIRRPQVVGFVLPHDSVSIWHFRQMAGPQPSFYKPAKNENSEWWKQNVMASGETDRSGWQASIPTQIPSTSESINLASDF